MSATTTLLATPVIRQAVGVRKIGSSGTPCITLPKICRAPLGIEAGDRVMVTLDAERGVLVVSKEGVSEGVGAASRGEVAESGLNCKIFGEEEKEG